MDRLIDSYEWLYNKYIEERLTLKEVAQLAGIPNDNATTVRRALLRFNIPVRSVSEGKTGRTHKGAPKSSETRLRISLSKIGVPNNAVWTQEARELLCHRCNAMLGLALDNPDILLNAAQYLQKHYDIAGIAS